MCRRADQQTSRLTFWFQSYVTEEHNRYESQRNKHCCESRQTHFDDSGGKKVLISDREAHNTGVFIFPIFAHIHVGDC